MGMFMKSNATSNDQFIIFFNVQFFKFADQLNKLQKFVIELQIIFIQIFRVKKM